MIKYNDGRYCVVHAQRHEWIKAYASYFVITSDAAQWVALCEECLNSALNNGMIHEDELEKS